MQIRLKATLKRWLVSLNSAASTACKVLDRAGHEVIAAIAVGSAITLVSMHSSCIAYACHPSPET